MLIPVVLMPLLSNEADHHQQWESSNALLLQQQHQPLEPPSTNQIFSQFLVVVVF